MRTHTSLMLLFFLAASLPAAEPVLTGPAPVANAPGPPAQRLQLVVEALGARLAGPLEQLVVVGGKRGRGVELTGAQRLGERLLEGAPNCHRLADRLHVR